MRFFVVVVFVCVRVCVRARVRACVRACVGDGGGGVCMRFFSFLFISFLRTFIDNCFSFKKIKIKS